jgi:hypothetical protein
MLWLSRLKLHLHERRWLRSRRRRNREWAATGNIEGGSIIVPLTSCLTGLDWFVLQIKTKIVSCHITNSEPVKQEVNGTVILTPLVFPGCDHL